jgi:Terpene synthase family 2, C-terminal metal binding
MANPVVALFAEGERVYFPSIPRLLPRAFRSDFEDLERSHDQWARDTLPFAGPEHHQFHMGARLSYLGALCFPQVDAAKADELNKLSSFLFTPDNLDEYSAFSAENLDNVNGVARDVIAVLRGTAPSSENMFTSATRSVVEPLREKMPPRVFNRFSQGVRRYVEGIPIEIAERARSVIGDTTARVQLRAESTFTTECYLALAQYAADVDVTDLLAADILLRRAETVALDHWLYTNDLYSFRKEFYKGDASSNIVTAIVDDKLTLQQAVERIAMLIEAREREFIEIWEKSELRYSRKDNRVGKWCEALGYIMSGNLEWARSTPRYNGVGYHWEDAVHGYARLCPYKTEYESFSTAWTCPLDPGIVAQQTTGRAVVR